MVCYSKTRCFRRTKRSFLSKKLFVAGVEQGANTEDHHIVRVPVDLFIGRCIVQNILVPLKILRICARKCFGPLDVDLNIQSVDIRLTKEYIH